MLSGWTRHRRDHGGVTFVDLRDRGNLVQTVYDPDHPEVFKVTEGVRNGFCLQVKGIVRVCPEDTTSANLTSGKVEVLYHESTILSVPVMPPL